MLPNISWGETGNSVGTAGKPEGNAEGIFDSTGSNTVGEGHCIWGTAVEASIIQAITSPCVVLYMLQIYVGY
jgi:hypothetical protein